MSPLSFAHRAWAALRAILPTALAGVMWLAAVRLVLADLSLAGRRSRCFELLSVHLYAACPPCFVKCFSKQFVQVGVDPFFI
jgi:hypothetical protein